MRQRAALGCSGWSLARSRIGALVAAMTCAAAIAAAMPARAAEPAELPDALPPADDAVLSDTSSLVRAFAAARLRGELEHAADFTRGDGGLAGASLGGRAGVEAQLDELRLLIEFAEAGRLGPASLAPVLVARPPLAPLHRAELVVTTLLFGLPAELSLGRAAVVIADGRLLGDEPFDLRGRTLDGGAARVRTEASSAGVGAWWLGGAGAALDAVAAADTSWRPSEQLALDTWVIAQRAGDSGLLVPTLGSRVAGQLWVLQGRAAAELQAPLVATTLEQVGVSGRLSAGARATLARGALGLSLPEGFVDLDGDLVAGDVIEGRVLLTPAPTRHAVRGALDLLAPDNTWCTALALGIAEERLGAKATGTLVGVVDRAGPLLDVAGAPVRARRRGGVGVALLELDLQLDAQLAPQLALGVSYGIALPGAALVGELPAQRLLIELRASTQEQ